MKRDAQIKACLATKRLSVLSETCEVFPADDSAIAAKVAAFVSSAVAAIPGGWQGITTGALDALAMGYAVGEYVFDVPGNLSAIRWHDPRRFAPHADSFGNIEGIEVLDAAQVFEPSRFIWFTYEGNYGNPFGESDLVAAYRPYATKDEVRRMWLTALDKFGTPSVVVKSPNMATQDEVDSVIAALALLDTSRVASVPFGYELEKAYDSGRVEPARAFVSAFDKENSEIARAILGQELTTGAGGSYAQGKVHENVLTDWIQALRFEIASEVLTGSVSKTLAMLNFGPNAPVPRVAFPNLTDAELAARRELISGLITGEVVQPTEGWIRRFLGVPAEGAN